MLSVMDNIESISIFIMVSKNNEHCYHNHVHPLLSDLIHFRYKPSVLFFFFAIRDRTGSAQLCPSGSSVPNKMTGNIKVWHYCKGSVTYEQSLYPNFLSIFNYVFECGLGLNCVLPRQ